MDQHVTSLISDYVLGLLPQDGRRQVEAHIANCGHCRHALDEERSLDNLIRQTLQVATQPSVGVLQRARPTVRPRRQTANAYLARQLAPVMVLLALLAGTLALQTTRGSGRLDLSAPAFYRLNTPTATSTSTPTATLAGLPYAVPPTAVSMSDVNSGKAPAVSQAPRSAAATSMVPPVSTPVATANTPNTD